MVLVLSLKLWLPNDLGIFWRVVPQLSLTTCRSRTQLRSLLTFAIFMLIKLAGGISEKVQLYKYYPKILKSNKKWDGWSSL
jgi:hypothetical protein